jgi:hypothetical protein
MISACDRRNQNKKSQRQSGCKKRSCQAESRYQPPEKIPETDNEPNSTDLENQQPDQSPEKILWSAPV